MEYIPGQDVSFGAMLAPNIEQLSLGKRALFLVKLASQINTLHHNTPSTGKPLVHGDINNHNIRSDRENGVSVFDFYNSQEMGDDPDELKPFHSIGTYIYMAPELFEKQISLKSDIYSLLPIFLLTLGAVNPFRNKETAYKFKDSCKQLLPETLFDFRGLFHNLAIPTYPVNIKPLIRLFLERMQSKNHVERPNSDELLQFTIAFYKCCLIFENTPITGENGVRNLTDEERLAQLQEQAAKLALLAYGKWSYFIGVRQIPITPISKDISVTSHNENPQNNSESPEQENLTIQENREASIAYINSVKLVPLIKTFEQHDFSESPAFNELTIIFSAYGPDFLSVIAALAHRPNEALDLLLKDIRQEKKPSRDYLINKLENFLGAHDKIIIVLNRQSIHLPPNLANTVVNYSEDSSEKLLSALEQLQQKNLLTLSITSAIINQPDHCVKITRYPSTTIAYLILTENQEAENYLKELNITEKLNLHKHLYSARKDILEIFGISGYRHLRGKILQAIKTEITNAIEKLSQHRNSFFDCLSSLWRNHTVAEEIKALQTLATAIDSNNFKNYFKDENYRNREIISRSSLAPCLKSWISNRRENRQGIILYNEETTQALSPTRP